VNIKRRYNVAITYTTINGLLYKSKALIVPENPLLRTEIIRIYYDNPLVGYFILAKYKDLIIRKYF
jgi:hypothetical protein